MRLVIVGSYPLSCDCIHGGVESSVYGLSQELATVNTVDVIDCPRMGGKNTVERDGNLTIHRYANPGKHNKDASQTIPLIVRDIVTLGADVCHIHGTSQFSLAMYEAMTRYGIHTIVTVHGLVSVEKRKSLSKKFSFKKLYQYITQTYAEKALLNRCPQIIVDTQYVADALGKYGLNHMPAIHVVPQGINGAYFQLCCSASSNIILSVGSISRRKGHLYLLRAFDTLCSKGIDAQLYICGIVAENDYLAAMQDYINQSPYGSRIKLKTNAPKEELYDAYCSAHVFALHSEEESQGIVFAEAMSCGLPVVATKIGGIPHVVKDGECGTLVEFEDVTDFANALERLMTNQQLWSNYSEAAKKTAFAYSWKDIAKIIMEIYNNL